MTILFNAIKMEKRFVALLLSIIIVIAGFNIIACLVLMVNSKRRDIAVLRTMGAKASMIASIFMIKGLIIGAAGVISGGIFGCFSCSKYRRNCKLDRANNWILYI